MTIRSAFLNGYALSYKTADHDLALDLNRDLGGDLGDVPYPPLRNKDEFSWLAGQLEIKYGL